MELFRAIPAFAIITLTLLACNVASSKDKAKDLERGDTCMNWSCIDTSKNKKIILKGLLRKYTPNETGKGAGHMFWRWEVLLADSYSLPAQAKGNTLDLPKFEGKRVLVTGALFYGIIIGQDEPHARNATGYRIDIEAIEKEDPPGK